MGTPSFPTPGVYLAPHDISLSLENVLIHELKAWVQASKFIGVHPACRGLALSLPLDQQLSTPVSHPAFDFSYRLDTSTTNLDRRKLPGCCVGSP
jgi:hypothetical protein